MTRTSLIAAALLVLPFAILPFARPTYADSASDAAIEAQCRPYFHDACSEAMGRWLPGSFVDGWHWVSSATHITKPDEFDYRADRGSSTMFEPDGPSDGTPFAYGSAGPPRGTAVYDPAHRIAFYTQGCCSWGETVLVGDAPPPPKALVRRDLGDVATLRGAKLGQMPHEVQAIYGPATMEDVSERPGLRVFSYTTRAGSMMDTRNPCGVDENFYVRDGRVIEIQLSRAC